ncbi:MAG: dTDP-4-dehydrorhamnose 3,5-epimerase family protein [Bacteroidetes bacterium]|nr:dTDP-4-dehydrorhamnose 3,5-epimerase family protein [Bacteroidota bacterium]
MKILSVNSLVIPSVKTIRYGRFSDTRGYFTEPYRRSDFENHSDMNFMKGVLFLQHNESYSKKYVLRGLHFQWNPYMGKMVRTIHGHMIDIFCDIRKESPTYGKVGMYDMPMSSDKEFSEWIWIPPGFAHGNLFLQETTIEYMCSGEYSQGNEAGISPLSTDLDWSLCDKKLFSNLSLLNDQLIISDKDKFGLSLDVWTRDLRSDNFIYGKL